MYCIFLLLFNSKQEHTLAKSSNCWMVSDFVTFMLRVIIMSKLSVLVLLLKPKNVRLK